MTSNSRDRNQACISVLARILLIFLSPTSQSFSLALLYYDISCSCFVRSQRVKPATERERLNPLPWLIGWSRKATCSAPLLVLVLVEGKAPYLVGSSSFLTMRVSQCSSITQLTTRIQRYGVRPSVYNFEEKFQRDSLLNELNTILRCEAKAPCFSDLIVDV